MFPSNAANCRGVCTVLADSHSVSVSAMTVDLCVLLRRKEDGGRLGVSAS